MQKLSGTYTARAYSPYAKRNFPEIPLWGETHLHTSWSMDARAFGNTLGPRDAYRAARGDEVISATGQAFRLSRPLDWIVIADHSDGLGMMGDIIDGTPQVTAFEQGARWSQGVRAGGQEAIEATMDMIGTFAQGKMDPGLLGLF